MVRQGHQHVLNRSNINVTITNTNRMTHLLLSVPSVPPDNITAHNTSSRSIKVEWEDLPLSQSNGNLTNFVVLHAESNTSEYIKTILPPNSYHAEIENLQIFQPYKIRVVAHNRRGEGVTSLPLVVWTEMEGK